MKDYNRFTKRCESGYIDIMCENCPNENKCEIGTAYCFRSVKEKLAEFEDKLENGTMVELPCKVGDTVYWACPYCEEAPEIECGKIRGLSISQNGTKWFSVIYDSGLTFEHIFDEDWGKTVFLTKADAEAKLIELQGAER